MLERTNPPILEPTMTKRSLTLSLLTCAALSVACGRDSGVGPLTSFPLTLDMEPSNSSLASGETRQLTVNALDQFGSKMFDGADDEWADKATYVSSAPEIARVSSGGLITAVAPGVTRITASLTVADYTVTGSVTTTVLTPTMDPPPADSATVTADPWGYWSPDRVTVWVGGTVTWTIPDGMQVGTMQFILPDQTSEKLEFTNGVASRTF